MSIEVLIKVEHFCHFSDQSLVCISLWFFFVGLIGNDSSKSDEVDEWKSGVLPRARFDRNLFQENRIKKKKLLEFSFIIGIVQVLLSCRSFWAEVFTRNVRFVFWKRTQMIKFSASCSLLKTLIACWSRYETRQFFYSLKFHEINQQFFIRKTSLN